MADRFEDLDAWKIGRELANRIYVYGRETPMGKDYGFKDQIQRAAVSVMNNIAEGLSEAVIRISPSFFSLLAVLWARFGACSTLHSIRNT